MKLLVFTYAPAGFGHLRVADALIDSRPKNLPYIILGSYDPLITAIHRFTSNNPIGKWFFTNMQYGLLEDHFTIFYRWFLISNSEKIYRQFKEIIEVNGASDEIWIVATHFGMAHQIGAVKDRLIKETGKKIRLLVQVTDDTSQHIWCVNGADLTFVPSSLTKKNLEKYARENGIETKFEVAPYPISPVLTKKCPKGCDRSEAFVSDDSLLNVAVPISGASVGLVYVTELISRIVGASKRFKFWVLIKKSKHSKRFIKILSKLANVKVIIGASDFDMINLYEKLYRDNLMHLEITKPSEQAFKAILPPSYVGGSVLLFTAPVGRQEHENIEFLKRQQLMMVDDASKTTVPRAMQLSGNPVKAADFVLSGLESGLFARLTSSNFRFSDCASESGEVGPSGTDEFWRISEKYFGG